MPAGVTRQSPNARKWACPTERPPASKSNKARVFGAKDTKTLPLVGLARVFDRFVDDRAILLSDHLESGRGR